MRIRPYHPDDAAALSALYFQSVHGLGALRYTPAQVAAWAPAPPDPAVTDKRARDGRLTLVAEDNQGAVAGFGDIEADGHIDRLYRRPGADAAGVGAALLEALMDHGVGQGAERLTVEASEMARGLFERHGFRVVERRDFERNGVVIHHYAMVLEGG
jgi:putative acetyltransferase